MKLKFDPALDYQSAAISAVADLWNGQATGTVTLENGITATDGLIQTEHALGNAVTLPDAALLENANAIRLENDLPPLDALGGPDFAIEMETGTGKTYVYLRTAFEMAQRYGFRKFIIVVPSVAIREGVLQSLRDMGEHFRALYGAMPFDYDVYDSKNPTRVRQFAGGTHLRFLVLNIQAFIKDGGDDEDAGNVIYRDRDGGRLIDFLSQTNPFVIIDEPQKMGTDKAEAAIARLNPAATFRYSATHRDTRNLLYRLGPVEALERDLVKRIEVDSVTSDDNASEAFVRLVKVDHTASPKKAQLEIFKMAATGAKRGKVTVKKGDVLFQKSKEHPAYTDMMIGDIDGTPGQEHITFHDGRRLDQGKEMGGASDEITRSMIRRAIAHHLQKERELRGREIKVLTLFFIDRVADYRLYEESGPRLGKVGEWFEEEYRALSKKTPFDTMDLLPAEQVHDGYFSMDKGRAKDTSGKTKADEDTYNLIMREKGRLLDPKVPLRFIFSHSALAEGWDNPNVFQICVLQDVGSTMRRRQQLGRGLRLPVSTDGERVHDRSVNRLVVVSNEAYKDFAAALQSEFEQESGIKFGEVSRDAFASLVREVDGEDVPLGIDGSSAVWEALRKKGYIDVKGVLDTEEFRPDDLLFDFELPGHDDIKRPVKDELCRYLISRHVRQTRDKETFSFRKQVQLGSDFQELWDRISHRTRYRVSFETDQLVAKAVERLKGMDRIDPLVISAEKVALDVEHSGVAASQVLDRQVHVMQRHGKLPDLIGHLQKESELTRGTLAAILRQAGRLDEFIGNPQVFMMQAAREISYALQDLMIEGIQYEKIEGAVYEMSRFEQDAEKGITRYLDRLYKVKNTDRSLYDFIEFDSDTERAFAEALDASDHVKFFVKLPGWFTVDTPVGPYNPDWAFVTARHDTLYFVRETKSTLDRQKRRRQENHKSTCGKAHFEILQQDFAVVTKIEDVAF